ncbi:hypothetical protein Tco_0890971 [Tanacetum coccineum]|uniref:Uncharacterized protein n=1 Tax=Tanacetum coccineum TaxID=301880 RepID=A0ABQ5C3F0_9ASTR
MFHKRPGSPLHMPYDEYALGYLKFSFKNTKRVRFGMTIPNTLIIEDIRTASYYPEYVAKTTKSTPSQPPKPKPAPAKPQEKKRKRALDAAEAPSQAKRSKVGRVSKKRTLQLRDEFIDEGVPATEPRIDDEEAIVQKVLEESMKDAYPAHRGPLPPVVFREPDSGKLQPLPEVQGKGKEKRHTPATAEPSGLIESSSLYVELGLTDSGTEHLIKVMLVHAGPNLDHMDLGIVEASSQPNIEQMDDEFTATAYPKVQENLKLPTEGEVRLKEPTSSAGTLSSMKNLDKDLSFTDQFLVEKSQEDEPEKTNTEAEVQSMVTVPILQDTSSVPLMTTPVIDITDPQSDSTTVPASMPTTTATVTETTTTTTVLPPPPQPQQDVSTSILIQTIGQLEQNIADLVDANQALEERLDKQGNRIHQLETQDLSRLIREQTVEFIDSQEIDRKIKESVKEVVTASVQHAMRAPLRARFKDLPTSDMKEILLQRMLEENYDKGHEDHKMAYEALQKSIIRDESEKFDADKAEERTKKKSKQDSPKTPPGSPPSPPPPPPPPDLKLKDYRSDDEDSGSRHIPKVSLNQEWFKPLSKKERPATPEPAWSIPSSSMHVPNNNWASALASSFVPPPENSLLSTDRDIGVFINWLLHKPRQSQELTHQKHMEGPAYKVVKAFHPNVIHLQFQMEECHKLLTNQVDEGLLRYNVNRPLPLGSPPGQVTIQTEIFFNKDLEYLRICATRKKKKGDRLAVSITKMKAASYPDAGLEQMVPDQMWAEEEYMYDISASYDSSSRADNQEYIIAESNFKDMYLSDFEDLYLLNLQGHLNHLPPKDKKILSTAVNLWIRNLVIRKWVEDFQLGIESYQTQLNLTKPRWEATGLEFMHDYKILDSPRVVVFRDRYGMHMIMRFNEIHNFNDETLQQINEALDYRVKEFKVNKVNPGLNTRFRPHGNTDKVKVEIGDTGSVEVYSSNPRLHT